VTPEEVQKEIEETEKADDRDKVDHRLVYNYRVATKKIHEVPRWRPRSPVFWRGSRPVTRRASTT
jgi:hypothetical protein